MEKILLPLLFTLLLPLGCGGKSYTPHDGPLRLAIASPPTAEIGKVWRFQIRLLGILPPTGEPFKVAMYLNGDLIRESTREIDPVHRDLAGWYRFSERFWYENINTYTPDPTGLPPIESSYFPQEQDTSITVSVRVELFLLNEEGEWRREAVTTRPLRLGCNACPPTRRRY